MKPRNKIIPIVYILLMLSAANGLLAQETVLRGEDHELARLELKGATVSHAVQLISEISNLNVVCTSEAGAKEVTLLVQGVTAVQAVETMCKVAGLWFRRDEDSQTLRVMTTEEFQKDHIVYRKDEIRTFTLKHPNAVSVATSIEGLFGSRVELSLGIDDMELDMLTGLEDARTVGGQGGGFQTGYGSGTGLTGGAGRYSRTGGLSGSGRYSRGVGSYGNSGLNRRGGGGKSSVDAENVMEEKLSADQISRLQKQLGQDLDNQAEELVGFTRKDPIIYVIVDRQHNLIVVRTSDRDAMDSIAALIADMDRPTPQVLLEMKILELSVGDSFRSIFDFEVMSGDSTSGTASNQPVNPLAPAAATSPSHVFGAGNFPLEGGSLVYQFLDDQIRARIQLLARDDRIEVVATPILLGSNNHPARMFVGEERVLTTGVNTNVVVPETGATTAFVEPVTEVRDVGNTLIIIPKINADRTVTLFISQDSSSVKEDSATIPVASVEGGIQEYPIDTVNTATLQATVVAKDGMTLALGGLIRIEQTNIEEKVPFLGDIPLLGLLFQKKVFLRSKSELILLITPRVLFTPAEAEAATEEKIERVSRHRFFKEGDKGMDAMFDEVDKRLDNKQEKEKK